jgi:hypothetical protein
MACYLWDIHDLEDRWAAKVYSPLVLLCGPNSMGAFKLDVIRLVRSSSFSCRQRIKRMDAPVV